MALKALFSINEIHMTVEPGVAATRDTPALGADHTHAHRTI